MRRATWLAGLGASGVLALAGAVDGCSSSSDHPPVLGGTSFDSGHGGSSSGAQGGSSSSGSSSGGPMCVAGDGGCTDLQLCGSQVNVHDATGTIPAPQGGAIAPGTYVLVKIDYYGAGGGAWIRQTMRITGSAGDGGTEAGPEGGTDASPMEAGDDGSASEAGSDGSEPADATSGTDASSGDSGVVPTFPWESIAISNSELLTLSSGTLTVPMPNSLTVDITCGGGQPFTSGYTATSTTLVLISAPEVLTFQRQ